ncbi:hypothetical protein ILUMI_27171 [Ignelater luminosus]|uniref:Nucleoredoxin n=1 Tax=Ignelater luminosus TaxID=2038154 RepID=A0A8K0C4U6_IGNLU|nr:hypothetical protein ILUMI_27171 [Ignelater luminosus]
MGRNDKVSKCLSLVVLVCKALADLRQYLSGLGTGRVLKPNFSSGFGTAISLLPSPANYYQILSSTTLSAESFSVYLESMPWLAIPWQQIAVRAELAQLYGIRGIPTLLLLDRNGHLITMDARTELAEDPMAQNFPWKPRAVNILTERFATRLHDYPAIILFVDGEETEVQFGESVLTPAANAYYKKHNINFNAPQEEFFSGSNDDHYLQFLVAVDTETSDVLRDLIGLDDVVPLLIAVDIPNRRFAIMEYGIEITAESVNNFVEQFQKGDLQFRSISERVIESDNIVNNV